MDGIPCDFLLPRELCRQDGLYIDSKDFRQEEFPQKIKRLNFEHPFSQTESGKPGLAQNVRTSYYGIKQEKAAGLA